MALSLASLFFVLYAAIMGMSLLGLSGLASSFLLTSGLERLSVGAQALNALGTRWVMWRAPLGWGSARAQGERPRR